MSSTTTIPQEAGAESLPGRKRKELDSDAEEQMPAKKSYMTKAREIRLEQNRKAARESRRRKKTMLEELQRSDIFFSRANGTLKQQNEELTRFLVQAKARVSAIESKENASEKSASEFAFEQAREHAADQAMYESMGFAEADARATAQSGNASAKSEPSSDDLPQMQPGATMQAMANFQQAATAAMQAAAQAMHANGALETIAAPPALLPYDQRIFSDAMATIAMQQAAAASAVSGQQFLNNPLMAPMISHTHAVAAQAMYQSKGFAEAGARATAQYVNVTAKSEPSSKNLPQMLPGATVQAMANFQQAATAAMQAAAQAMEGNGALETIAAPPALVPYDQRIYSDTMATIAMQQAAAVAAVSGQQFLNNPFMAPMIAWQSHHVAAAMAQASAPLPGSVQFAPQNPAPQLSSPNKLG